MKFSEIVVVSNIPDEFAEREDRKLAEALKTHMPTRFELLEKISPEKFLENTAYIFRCIYDDSIGNVTKDMGPIYSRLREMKVPYLTVFNGKGDQTGKHYLAELY